MKAVESPKYVEIARDLRARVATGEFQPGDRLPTQQDLADYYKVTVMTLRQALAELESDGLVLAHRGRGTFVAEARLDYPLNHLSSFAQEMERQGRKLVTKILTVDTTTGGDDDEARQQLTLDPGTPMTRLVRVRIVDSRPIVLQTSYLPARLAGTLSRPKLRSTSLYDYLAREAGVRVVRAIEAFRPLALTKAEAEALARPTGSPALLSTRLSLAFGDRPVLFDRALLAGDACQVVADRIEGRLTLSYQLR